MFNYVAYANTTGGGGGTRARRGTANRIRRAVGRAVNRTRGGFRRARRAVQRRLR